MIGRGGDSTVPLDAPRRAAAREAGGVVDAWLAVLMRMLRLPNAERSAIRDELEEHLRDRVRDLILSGEAESEAQRIAVKELGETAALARRLENANRSPRRRLAMQLSMIGLGAMVVTAGALVLSPGSSAPQPSLFEDRAERSSPPAALSEYTVTITADGTLRGVVEQIDAAIPQSILVRWPEIDENGASPDLQLHIDLEEAPVSDVMPRIIAILDDYGTYDWRFGPRVIELAPQSVFDRRESALVSYAIGHVLESIEERFVVPYDDACGQVVDLVITMVDSDSWMDNGGSAAHLMIVGGKMFVQAPPRMHAQIEWILAELADGGDPDLGAGQRPDGGEAAEAPGRERARLDADRARLLDEFRSIVLTCPPDDPEYRRVKRQLREIDGELGQRIGPGDHVEVQVFELYAVGEWSEFTRRVDRSGILRIPELGAVPAAGTTELELETLIRALAGKEIMVDPQINVTLVRDEPAVSLRTTVP